jgi:glycosyltransferase involved in cell wall biosynthesis
MKTAPETKLSVVIPVLNEEADIGAVIDQIPVKELNKTGYQVEIIVVDNNSTDSTGENARAHRARVIFQPVRGYGNAYKAGFSNATGNVIATGDADMTYPFDALPELLTTFHENKANFITTDRLSGLNPKAMTTSHIFGNWLLSIFTRMLFRVPFKDSQSGMWIFRRSIWPHLDVRSDGMPFSQELKVEAFVKGFKCMEVPIEYRPRVGEVKLNAIKDGIRNRMHLLKKRLTIRRKKQK